jgi:hypothetical protein
LLCAYAVPMLTSEHAMVADDSNAALMEFFIIGPRKVFLLGMKCESIYRITE